MSACDGVDETRPRWIAKRLSLPVLDGSAYEVRANHLSSPLAILFLTVDRAGLRAFNTPQSNPHEPI
ncbi:hypothetical protein PBY51_008866 [Eleginops maclovinus]|uniref:Uncharacterized protein n=1 Tax=Eleginops maclovinus TaxID=56733 RepID=A0AAN8ABT2_ELEMC|nr:hypothetical protein PBY51_008866 [Eleginops maclovinus]